MTMQTIASAIDVGSFDSPGGTTGGLRCPVAGARYLMEVKPIISAISTQRTLHLLHWRRQRSDLSASIPSSRPMGVARKLPKCGWQKSARPWRAIVVKLDKNKYNNIDRSPVRRCREASDVEQPAFSAGQFGNVTGTSGPSLCPTSFA